MATQQPEWKEVGTVGDVYPEYDGGFVSVDTTGVYEPELEYVKVPADDDDFESPRARWTVYRVVLDRGVPNWGELEDVASSAGQDPDDLREWFDSDDPMERASAYMDWAGHYGWHEFDQDPLTLTRAETEKRYDADLGYKRDIESALEETVERMADESGAQAWSTIGDQMLADIEAEGYDPESAVCIAEFGDAQAVNGDILVDSNWEKTLGVRPSKHPKLWSEVGTRKLEEWLEENVYELTHFGGRVPVTEDFASADHVADAVAKQLKLPVEDVVAVAETLDWWQEEIPRSVSGNTSTWAKKKSGTTEERRRTRRK